MVEATAMVSTGPVEKRALAAVPGGERREGLESDGRLKRNREGADEGEEEESMIYLYRTDA